MSEDTLMTLRQVMARWCVTGPTPRAQKATFDRRAGAWGLKPLSGTRGVNALFRPVDVLRAEERGAKQGGNAVL